MPSSPQSVLITGANGFVGARLCRLFIEKGFDVIAAVRKTSNLSQLEGLKITCRYGDVTDPASLKDIVSGVDYVIHNAGLVKAKKKDDFFAVNERGTRALMEAIAEHNPDVHKVVCVSSTSAAGPSKDNVPLIEEAMPDPVGHYGRSKLAGERAALAFADRLPVVVVRPPAVYGPGDKEILTFFQTANRGIRLYLGDTRRRIQVVHVDDLCRGVYLALSGESTAGSVYVIAECRSYSMKELVDMLADAAGKKGLPIFIPGWLFRAIAAVSEAAFKIVGATPMLTREKARELLASWEYSTARAADDLGYVSEIPFLEGARTTFQWYRSEGWL